MGYDQRKWLPLSWRSCLDGETGYIFFWDSLSVIANFEGFHKFFFFILIIRNPRGRILDFPSILTKSIGKNNSKSVQVLSQHRKIERSWPLAQATNLLPIFLNSNTLKLYPFYFPNYITILLFCVHNSSEGLVPAKALDETTAIGKCTHPN